MTIQISIIGLGQIGASIGLALSDKQYELNRVGHDLELDNARRAEKMGAVDRVAINLPSGVRDANVVILSLPVDQIRETMEIIAPELKEDAVVMDTAPINEVMLDWSADILPDRCHYISLTPAINPAYLFTNNNGLEAAHSDLFQNGLMAIAVSPSANSDAVKLASDLTYILGASPLFVDPAEIDGLMAATHLLPQLLASSLINITVDQPGWNECRKVTGRAYTEATSPIAHLDGSLSLSESVLNNKENTLRVLDNTIAALQELRVDIESPDSDALEKYLERAYKGRQAWWQERQSGDWLRLEGSPADEVPSTSSIFGRLLGLGRRTKPKE
jgi:prephenate dehydrogenase